MALSLGVSVGRKIAVGASVLEIRAIPDPTQMIIAVDGGKEIAVSDDAANAVQVLPGVRVFVGLDTNGNRNRLAFEAPKSIPIKLLPNTD